MNRPDYGFLLDESQSNDPITARFPRTLREAFGPAYKSAPLRRDISFVYRAPSGMAIFVAVIVVALILGVLK